MNLLLSTVFQTDGNLVVYHVIQFRQAVWASGTNNKGANDIVLQRDSNMVLYPDTTGNNPIWSTRTNGRC